MKRILLPAALAVLGGGVALTLSENPAAAAAQCPPGTEFAARPYLDSTGTLQQNPGCYPSNQSSGPAPLRFRKYFGALAYDERKSAWYSFDDATSQSEARTKALGACRDGGGGACKLMLSYSNQCAAVARAHDAGGPIVGNDSVNTGSFSKDAQANAIRACRADWGAKQCSIVLSECSLHGRKRETKGLVDEEETE